MAIDIKTLASGTLRLINASFTLGERVLYAAPHPEAVLIAPATVKKTAMITGMRFFNSATVSRNIALRFVRYTDPVRQFINVLPFPTVLNPGELRVETIPLVLEEGDLIIGFASEANEIHYVISGIEREV